MDALKTHHVVLPTGTLNGDPDFVSSLEQRKNMTIVKVGRPFRSRRIVGHSGIVAQVVACTCPAVRLTGTWHSFVVKYPQCNSFRLREIRSPPSLGASGS